jgi:hypothetical protein
LCTWGKISFLNFSGTIGQKTPVETSPARHWVLASRKASLRDLSPNRMLRFCTAILLGRHSFKIDWIRRPRGGNCSVDTRGRGGGGGRERQKISNNRFSNLADTTSAHWTRKWKPSGVDGAKWGRKHGTKLSPVVCDQSRAGKIVVNKNEENGELWRKLPTIHSQSGVARLHVSQLAGKESKGLPMVTWFLLLDAADMGIGGVSGGRKFCIGGGALEWYRCSKEALCILECLLCLVCALQRFWPTPLSGDQLRGATLVRNLAKIGGKNSPCQENIATI